MFCDQCGTKLPENARFCDRCGAQVVSRTEPTDPRRAERPNDSSDVVRSNAQQIRDHPDELSLDSSPHADLRPSQSRIDEERDKRARASAIAAPDEVATTARSEVFPVLATKETSLGWQDGSVSELDARMTQRSTLQGESPSVPAEVTCARCGGKNLARSRFCDNCGSSLETPEGHVNSLSDQLFTCGQCGTTNLAGSRFCESCGKALLAPVSRARA
jgi:DNA-directed RNA polymerase subunit M/transcription elongation factor TFIIS